MIRKLLACLAFLTGLSAAGVAVPANAAVILTMSTEATASVEAASRNCSGASEAAQPRTVKPGRASIPVRALPGIILRAPSVYLGCDRARE